MIAPQVAARRLAHLLPLPGPHGVAVSLVIALVGGGLIAATQGPGAAAGGGGPARPGEADRARASAVCIGSFVEERGDDADRVAEVLQGKLRLPQHSAYPLPTVPTWRETGDGSANWAFQFQTLMWVDRLRRVAQDRDDATLLARYADLLRSWSATDTRDVPQAWVDMTVGVRAEVLTCALAALGPQPWLVEALERHGLELADPALYTGIGNHALHQNIGLLTVGHALARDDWADRAATRTADLLRGAVDDQGVSTEGAVAYQWNNLSWWLDARDVLRATGRDDPALHRLELMPDVLAHLTAPDGSYEMLGDTALIQAGVVPGTTAEFAATRGASGPRPDRTLVAYRAGYLANRSGWGERRPVERETAYTLRFGPGRPVEVHGHADAGSITLFAGGRRLLWDQGLGSYYGGGLRSYLLSPEAHNRITVTGVRVEREAGGRLTTLVDDDDLTLSTIEVDDLPGVRWTRTVLWVKDGGFLLVLDDVLTGRSSAEVVQRWHLPHDGGVALGRRTVATTGGVQHGLDDLTVAWTGEMPEVEVVRGRAEPMLGWRSLRPGDQRAAPVVTATRRGPSARFVTLLVPSSAGLGGGALTDVVAADRPGPATGLTVTVGGRTYRVALSATSASVHRLP